MIFSKLHWVFCGLLALSACGNTADDDLIKDLLARATSSQEEVPAPDIDALRAGFTPQVLAQIDSPVLLVELPTLDSAAALTLSGVNNGVETFLTTDGKSISLKDGVVVATRGLGFDLMTADTADVRQALRDQAQSAVRIHRYLDGENQLVARSFMCTYTHTATLRSNEVCNSADGAIENSYIFDNKGNTLSSSQWISPRIGDMLITRLQ